VPSRRNSGPCRLASASLLVVSLSTTGCGLLYRTSHHAEHFSLYADRSDGFVERSAATIDAIFHHFLELFDVDARQLAPTTICLDGEDDDVVDHNYRPDLLGYYVPFFRFIRVDTRAAMTTNEHGLQQVLLHEIAHHFIVHEYPNATRECWLNEGIAGNLEMTTIDDGVAEHPLLNPVLHQIARRTIARDEPAELLRDVLDSDWESFHDTVHRERNYAVSWSIVHFLLREHLPSHRPLGRRLEALYEMDRDEIVALSDAWRRFTLELDPIDLLATWAVEAPDLRARWALRQLGETKGADSARALEALRALIEGGSGERAEQACVAFLHLLARTPHAAFFAAEATADGLELVRSLIADAGAPMALRARLVESVVATHITHDAWFPVLVSALESRDPRLRVAAAAALGESGVKQTIVSPVFWTHAPANAREREVREWKDWLSGRHGDS